MKTLQEQYNQIIKGNGSKEIFLKEVKSKYPNLVRNAAGFQEASNALIGRNIISEGIYVATGRTEKPDWFSIFDENMNVIAEEAKAVENKVSKEVTDLQAPDKGYDYKDDKMLNNVSGEQFRQGYFTELTDVANKDKTKEELIDLVIKNIDKNPLYYVEEAQFGVKGIGYTDDAPGLKVSDKEIKGKYASSGMEEVKLKEGMIKLTDLINEAVAGYVDLRPIGMTNENARTDAEEEGYLDGMRDEKEDLEDKAKDKAKKKKVKKETIDSKLAEIENAGKVTTLEAQIEALDEAIETKNQRISMVSEDENLSELVDKVKMKEMQREVKDLERRKAKMEKLYEKMCGKAYSKPEMVDEVDEMEY